MTALAKPVLLVGMMGSGKSACGRLLAFQLGVPFVDADDVLVQRFGKSIPEMFAQDGETVFRQREKQILAELMAGPPAVIAAGGGAILDAGTRADLRTKTHAFWLKATLDDLVERVGFDKNRPLLKTAASPREALQNLLAARAPLYAETPHHIDTHHKTPDAIVGEIVRHLRELV